MLAHLILILKHNLRHKFMSINKIKTCTHQNAPTTLMEWSNWLSNFTHVLQQSWNLEIWVFTLKYSLLTRCFHPRSVTIMCQSIQNFHSSSLIFPQKQSLPPFFSILTIISTCVTPYKTYPPWYPSKRWETFLTWTSSVSPYLRYS